VSQNNQQFDQTARLAGLVGQIGCLTGFAAIIVIGLAFGVGRLLDGWMESSGIFTILFLIGSFPITLYVIVRVSLAVLKRAQAPDSDVQANESDKPTTTEEKELK
jgi:F0F1-type ATP synthase assembly protein I